ncbi:hypothetical protein WJ96_05205 [Burkholderia ubonensis]|uniref:Uncharacterized protein n=1 Tax=Burkholderia ubonensis TaxID=101571 RepID=A0AAW3MQX4_9BURK|nr:hypothetical protein WJ96_05205 [Burkholderia ubonensis]KVZ92666.1 hypothetical protein WL25_16860 [Burkholderia ubonensis]
MQLESTNLNTLDEQTRAGGGWLLLDFAGRREHLDHVRRLVQELNRQQQLHVVDFVEHAKSATLDLFDGSPPDIADDLVSMLPPVPQGFPGAMYYRAKAHDAIEFLTSALRAAGETVSFVSLNMLLSSTSAIRNLEARVRECDVSAYQRLAAFLDELHADNARLRHTEEARLKEVLGGVAGRIAQFGQGRLGAVFNSVKPGIQISAVVKSNHMLYLRLPAYEAFAEQIARVISAKLNNSLARAGGKPNGEQGGETFLKFELFA